MEEVHEMYKDVIQTSLRGYSKQTRNVLYNWTPFTLAGKSNTNGAVMRVSPLALVFHTTDVELYEQIKDVVYCTHGDSTDALDAAFVHVKLLKSLITETRKTAEEMYTYALYLASTRRNKTLYSALVAIGPDNKKRFQDNNWNITKTLYGFDLFQIEAIDCLVCALVCFLYNFNKPKEALIMAANNGGDTDTVAKLVGDLVGACHGTKWVPLEWQDIEGKLELVSLGTTLYHRYNKATAPNSDTRAAFETVLHRF
jgi:ADP-ribosylglycohydrolase